MPEPPRQNRNVPTRSQLVTASPDVTFRFMDNEYLGIKDTRVSGMTRRVFLRATLAGGASLLAGRAATFFAAASPSDNSTFSIGGDLQVNRLGFGAMRLTGEGIWGWHLTGRMRAKFCDA